MALPRSATTFRVEGVADQASARTVQAALANIDGVHSVKVELATGFLTVTYSPDVTSPEHIGRKIEDAGYKAQPREDEWKEKEELSSPQLQVHQTSRVAAPQHSATVVFQAENEQPCETFGDSLRAALNCFADAVAVTCIVRGTRGPPLAVVGFDSTRVSAEDIEGVLKMTRLRLSTSLLSVKGMTCQSCVRNIESHVGQEPGVKGVKVSLEEECARFVYDGEVLSTEALVEKIEDMGFECSVLGLASLDAGGPGETDKEPERPAVVLTPKQPVMAAGDGVEDRTQQGSLEGTEKCFLRVIGMTCSSCVAAIEKQLFKVKGVKFALVALLAQKAEVRFDPALVVPSQLVELINDMGFEASLLEESHSLHGEAEFVIRGMTCASCVHAIETNVCKLPGVASASVCLATQKGRFFFDPERTGPRQILDRIKDLGFEAFPFTDHKMDASYLSQKEEVKKWRNSFLLSLVFGVPSMLLMMYYMIRRMLHKQDNDCCIFPGLSAQNFILFLLATPVQFVGGRYFYVQAWKALSHGVANMDVLIMLATSISYFYSVVIALYFMIDSADHSPKTFFETPPMLLMFISLGRWLEHIAKGKTSAALAKLISLQATEAVLVEVDYQMNITDEKPISVDLVQRGDVLKRYSGAVKPGRSIHEQTRLDAAQPPRYARLGIPWDPADLGRLVLERCWPLVLVPEPPGRPTSLPSVMEELRRRRDFVRQDITRGVAAIESLLQDPGSPTEQIRSHLLAVNTKYEEMKVLDERVQEIIDLDELEADFFASFDYAERVHFIRAHVSFARPSAVPSQVAARSTGAPNAKFAVTRHGETAALSGETKTTVEADNVANVDAVCEPLVCDLHVRTAREVSHRPEQLAELAPGPLDGQRGAPSSPPSDDCPVLADGQVPELSKDLVTPKYNDVADPERPRLRFSGGSDFAAAREGFFLKPRVGDRCERELFPLARRWPSCSRHWLLCWRRLDQDYPPLIKAHGFRIGSREPPSEPGCGQIVNGSQAASMTPLGGRLKRSWKLSHRLPGSSFRKHVEAAPHLDPCNSRQGMVTCDQLKVVARCVGYTRACHGHTAGHVNRRHLPQNVQFPYDPGGYYGGDQGGDRGTENHHRASHDQNALPTDPRSYAIT